jgi:hypothetical protein
MPHIHLSQSMPKLNELVYVTTIWGQHVVAKFDGVSWYTQRGKYLGPKTEVRKWRKRSKQF